MHTAIAMRDRHENFANISNAFSRCSWHDISHLPVRWLKTENWRRHMLRETSSEVWSLSDFMVFIGCLVRVCVCAWLFSVLQIDKVVIDDVPNDVLKTWMGRPNFECFRLNYCEWINFCTLSARSSVEPKFLSYLTVLICERNPVFADVIRKTN